MKLTSLQCPNCNSSVKQVGEGKFYCENCGTSFLADYDKEDVEFEKIKAEGELRKEQLNEQLDKQRRADAIAKTNEETAKIVRIIVIVLVVVFLVIPGIVGVILSIFMVKSEYEQSKIRVQQEQSSREQAKIDAEEKEKKEKEAREVQEAVEKKLRLDSFKIKPEDIMADSFFVENATKSIETQLKDNSNLYYTNWEYGEPEYITSYILHAKNEDERTQNIVLSIYKVNWDKVYDDHTEHYVMYDGACLENVSYDENGKLKTDYEPHSMSYHSEIIANQFLSGYSDYDQLIRQEIYGNSDYNYTEFNMKGE